MSTRHLFHGKLEGWYVSMNRYLQKKFALSEQGSKDLIKASISCAITNIGLMLPVGLICMLVKDMLEIVLNGEQKLINLWEYVGISILLVIAIFIMEYIQYNKTFLASYVESANKRISLAERLRKLPLSYFGNKDLSDLTTTIMSDCAGLETSFSHFMPNLFGAIISTLLIGIGMFKMNTKLAIALLWVVPVAFLITILSKKYQDNKGVLHKEKKLDVAYGIQECIETIKEIKSNNQEANYLKNLDEKLGVSEKYAIASELTTGIFVTSAQMILRLGIVSVILVGSNMLINKEIDIFTLLVFLIAASRIYDPLSSSLINLAAVFASLLQVDRMNEIEQHYIQGGKENPTYNGYDISFKDVHFAYNDEEGVLENISFTARQGEVTALVGPSGGGKSTIAKLAARFWDIEKGQITLGDVDISGIDPETLLKSYAVVFQDVTLFNNTIMENIRIGKHGASDEEVYKAAKLARCDEFITRLPQGYQTIIGENGDVLSGGERQRLSIARALLKDAPVILLDEATASLDVENETKIQDALSNLVKNKTVLVIAHRMRTVAGADKIIVLDDGKIAEEGSPDYLMKKNGIYSNMVKLQRESSQWEIK